MVEQVEISEILNKLICGLGANSASVMLSQDLYFSTSEDFSTKIWNEYKNIKQPKLLEHSIALPIMRKKSLRVLLFIEKNNPNTNDAMYSLTWMLNHVTMLEQALRSQFPKIKKNVILHDVKIKATPCSPGIAMGRVMPISSFQLLEFAENIIDDVPAEVTRLTSAVKKIVGEMKGLGQVLAVNNISSDLFNAYCNMLDRHGLLHEASEYIIKNKCSSEYAVHQVIRTYIKHFQQMSDPYLRARAIDLKDIGARILNALNPSKKNKLSFPNRTIIVAEDISPLTIGDVPLEKLAGIVCTNGSKYSHASILARALGVPFVIEAKDLSFVDIKDKVAIVDGYIGSVHINPPESSRRSLKDSLKYECLLENTFQDVRPKTSEIGDGTKVSLYVNVGLGHDIQGALRTSADGVGLFRTEIPFMLQNYLPSVSAQAEIYSQILKSFHPKPVVIRTLDIGGDKQLPYISKPENNPYLGTRGFRFSMEFPSVFRMQVEAMFRANEGLGNCKILLPMITSIDEVIFARDVINDVRAECGFSEELELGVMLEVPGIIALVGSMVDYVDFYSVGTNDLTQYILAVDRNNGQVANLYDSWHPAVLRVLKEILILCNTHKKPVSVCGELAGDPMGSLLLFAMGYRSISMNHKNLLKVKWLLRQFTVAELSGFWDEIEETPALAHKIIARRLSERDLGRFVSKR